MEATPPSQPPLGRRRIVYVAGAGAAAIAVVVGLVLAFTGGGSSPRSSSDALGGTTTTRPEQRATASTRPKGATTTSSSSAGKGAPGTNRANTSTSTAPTTSTAPGTGEGSTSPFDRPPPVTLETTPPAINQAYIQTYMDTCKSIWANADSDGILIDIDDPDKRPFLLSDCTSLMDTDTGEFLVDTVADAQAQAQQDALWNLDDVMWGRRLRNTSGTKTWVSPISSDGH